MKKGFKSILKLVLQLTLCVIFIFNLNSARAYASSEGYNLDELPIQEIIQISDNKYRVIKFVNDEHAGHNVVIGSGVISDEFWSTDSLSQPFSSCSVGNHTDIELSGKETGYQTVHNGTTGPTYCTLIVYYKWTCSSCSTTGNESKYSLIYCTGH